MCFAVVANFCTLERRKTRQTEKCFVVEVGKPKQKVEVIFLNCFWTPRKVCARSLLWANLSKYILLLFVGTRFDSMNEPYDISSFHWLNDSSLYKVTSSTDQDFKFEY